MKHRRFAFAVPLLMAMLACSFSAPTPVPSTDKPTGRPPASNNPPNTATVPPSQSQWCDIYQFMNNTTPNTIISATASTIQAVELRVTYPDGHQETIPFTPVSGQYEAHSMAEGAPQIGTYVCNALDASGNVIPGGMSGDVYLDKYEIEPAANIRAEVTPNGILVTWDAVSIPKDPNGNGSVFYVIPVFSARNSSGEEVKVYEWFGETNSHLIPLRSSDMGNDTGLALEALPDGVYSIEVSAVSRPPEGLEEHGNEFQIVNTNNRIYFSVQDGQVQITQHNP